MSFRASLALVTAIVALASLALQFALTLDRMTGEGATALEATWRYLSYFTILTNCLVATVALAMARKPDSALAGPRARLTAVSAIVLVAIVYSAALRHTWNPQGWQLVADHGLHDASPLLFLASWFAFPHGMLRWRDTVVAITVPIAYCVYALVRGAFDGWYAYWFLDPSVLSLFELARNILVITAVFLVIAGILVGFDRLMGRRRSAPRVAAVPVSSPSPGTTSHTGS